MDSKKSGMELLEILLIVFVILKLVGTIDWSWWWVLSPILIPIGLLIVASIVLGIISVIIK